MNDSLRDDEIKAINKFLSYIDKESGPGEPPKVLPIEIVPPVTPVLIDKNQEQIPDMYKEEEQRMKKIQDYLTSPLYKKDTDANE